jgi:hypothetical protein
MRKVAAVAVGAFLLGTGVFTLCAQWFERGRAEAMALASAGVAMAIGATFRPTRRRALPLRAAPEAAPQRANGCDESALQNDLSPSPLSASGEGGGG